MHNVHNYCTVEMTRGSERVRVEESQAKKGNRVKREEEKEKY